MTRTPTHQIALTALLSFAICWALGWLGPTLDYMDEHRANAEALQDARAAAREVTRRERAGKAICGPNSRAEWSMDDRQVTCMNNGTKRWVVRLDGAAQP